jgi:hypothetical protein
MPVSSEGRYPSREYEDGVAELKIILSSCRESMSGVSPAV